MHNKIRRYRKSIGMTQIELARKSGISRPFLSHIESNLANPTVEKAFAIANVLGRTVDDVFQKEFPEDKEA